MEILKEGDQFGIICSQEELDYLTGAVGKTNDLRLKEALIGRNTARELQALGHDLWRKLNKASGFYLNE